MSNEKRAAQSYKYRKVEADTKSGYKRQLVYIGNYYSLDFDEPKVKQEKRKVLIMEVLSLLVFVISSMQRSELNQVGFAAGMIMLSVTAWIFELVAAGFFVWGKYPWREDDYRRINYGYLLGPIIRAISMALAVGYGILKIVQGEIEVSALIVLAGYLICAIVALLQFSNYYVLRKEHMMIDYAPKDEESPREKIHLVK